MIATIDVQVSASNPTIPLFPWRTFRESLSTFRVRNVPKKIGKWNITRVSVSAKYPDNKITNVDCVLIGGVWIATMPKSDVAGRVANGYAIVANGIDENGNELDGGYVLGRGDIVVVDCDFKTTTVPLSYSVRLLPKKPEKPNDGDIWLEDDVWHIHYINETTTLGLSKDDVETMIANIKPSDIGALGDKGELLIRADDNRSPSLTLDSGTDGGAMIHIVDNTPAGKFGAAIQIGTPYSGANHGARIDMFGGSGETPAIIEMHDSDMAAFQPKLRSEIMIGDVKVRASLESISTTLEPVTTTLSGYVKDVVESAYPNADTKEY